MRVSSFWTRLKRFGRFWSDAKVTTFGSSVAYFATFSLAPLLLIAISITSFFVSKATVESSIIAQFQDMFGANGASLASLILNAHISQATGLTASIVGFVILLLGAAGVFTELRIGLDTIFSDLPIKEQRGLWATIKSRLLSFGMVLSVGFLLLLSLALSAGIASITETFTFFPEASFLATILELGVSFLLVSFFLALVYKVLPSHRLRWAPALVGGGIAGILFTISKYFIGVYLSSSTLLNSYGAASALVLLIVWTYYMSLVFFFSAVITRLYVVPKVR